MPPHGAREHRIAGLREVDTSSPQADKAPPRMSGGGLSGADSSKEGIEDASTKTPTDNGDGVGGGCVELEARQPTGAGAWAGDGSVES